MSEDIRKIMEADLAKYPKTVEEVSRATISTPVTDQFASRKPMVKEIATKTYNTQTGAPHVHPMYLMTMMADECPWVDLSMRVVGSACSSTIPLFRISTTTSKAYKKKRASQIEEITQLLMYPNPHQTGYELFRTTYENMVLYGNAYWQIIKNKKGDLHSFYTLPPESIHAVPYFDGFGILHFAYVQMDIVGEPRVFMEEEIIHFKTTNSKSFIYGKPLFLPQLVQIASSISAKKSLASWFEQSFAGGAIFKMDADPDTAERNRTYIKEFFTSPENFGRTMLLEGEMELVRDGNKFAGFDFDKLSAVERDQILIAAGIPLSQAGVRSSAGNANAEIVASEEKSFMRNTFGMYHNLVFEKINSKLFRQILGWNDVNISAGAPIRFSLKDEIQTVNALSRIGIQVDEARDLLSVARVPDEEAGKTFIIGTNNGLVKVEDIIGINMNTGEKTLTIFEKTGEGPTSFDSGGMGGQLKKKVQDK